MVFYMKEFFTFGEKVVGYDVRVLNEREARAGAGLLFAFGFLAFTNSVMLGHLIFTKYFISFFTLDFLLRVINPNYSPSLLMGRFFVRNQTPEYVGAIQKRFAWGIGLMLAIPMFFTLVLYTSPSPINVIICILCLLLLITESAFSICAGCKIYNLIYKDKATNCPGGVCEIKQKDPIQKFNTVQKIIAISSGVLITFGLYMFMIKVENKTFFAKMISTKMMSKEQLKARENQQYLQEVKDFESEDEDF